MRGGMRTIVEPHDRFKGVFVLRGKDDALVTKNLTVGESVYNEKRVSVDVSAKFRSSLGVTPSPDLYHVVIASVLTFRVFPVLLNRSRKQEKRLNTECGTPSDPSSQHPSSVVSKTSTCSQAARSFTLVPPPVLQCPTSLTLSDP
jgi:hypothetical protein